MKIKFIQALAIVLLCVSVNLPCRQAVAQGTWTQKTSLPGMGRLAAVAFPIGNKGYLGIGNTYNGFTDDFWEYDAATDSWTQKANFLGGPRNFATGFAIGSKGYFSCGESSGPFQNDFWEYDPGTNTWTQKANLGGVARTTASGFSVNGYGYIGTGFDVSATCLTDFWRYDPGNNTWTQMGNFPGGKRIDVDRATFIIGNKAYWGTGWDQNASPSIKYNDLWEYDSPTDTWTQKANIPTPGRWGAIGFSLCNKGFIGFGTYSGISVPYKDFWQFDPATNFWSPVTPFPLLGRVDASVVVINNKAYIGTGFDTSLTMVNSQWEYTLNKDWWEFSLGATVAVTAIPDTICLGGSTTLVATGGSNYSWNTGATTSSIVVSPTATTTYSALDPSSACAAAGNITVVVIQSSTATISGSTTICGGQSATLTASGGVSYSWNPGGQTTPSIIVNPTSSTTYSVDVNSPCGLSTSTVTVSVISGVTASISGNNVLCTGGTATLTASGGGNYSWSTGTTSASITVTPTTTTAYTVTVSTGSGCTATATSTVTVSPPPVAAVSGATICAGQNATLSASGGAAYSWNNGATTSDISVAPTATSTYSVFVSIGSCSDTASATVTVNSSPSVSVSGNTLLCIGDIATLTASGSTNYSWSTGATTASITAAATATTTYSVVTSNGICTSAATVTVTVSPPPVATVSSATICSGQNATMIASGGGNYLWSTGATTAAVNVAPAITTSYSVIVSIGSCADTASGIVTVNPAPTVNAGTNVTVSQGQSTTLIASGGSSYSWSNGAIDSVISVSPIITTAYCVTITNTSGCTDMACVTVFVSDSTDCFAVPAEDFYVPNAFSPNGDGENDVLKLYFGKLKCIKEFKFTVYNRWGEKVFETTDAAESWTGEFRGKNEDSGAFIYYMDIIPFAGDKVIKKGNVSLMR